ncbi:MAG TPA: dihydrolipoyl dehydrogenase [Candidatus Diapherotrites archaeon]|uniref:Dihydrolipoyl dehydrogenase n=1 Tax=Candidatus Iainarchaeum sp. TaxID=3101447 RepID=A0A7J4JHA9_9ARCH|nr:dihydrolipoyl dehydrogenase [Candidatus Diapherotrites archaeon]HIH16704.1 dihydrolipoyl dehydrogenase [Candidatus Diapherotrites archaeon]
MVMGELAEQFDVAVLGAGPGGYVAAIRAAQLGKHVVVIDPAGIQGLGGVCLHAGCIPSKAIIYASTVASTLENAMALGFDVGKGCGKGAVDLKKLQEWKNNVVRKLDTGIAGLFTQLGVETITGKAFFQSSNRVGIEGEKASIHAVEFKKCIIATGGSPISLPGLAFDGSTVLSSAEALDLDFAPEEFVVVGGGYIGVELGTAFQRFGSRVTLIEFGERILPGLDPDLVAVVEQRIRAAGVKIVTKAKATGVEKKGKKLVVQVETANGKLEVSADKVLVAVGRKTDARALKLENTRVQLDEKGLIKVDAQGRTTDSSIFAVGDITPGPALAHKAYRQGKVAAEALAGLKSAFDNRCVPLVVFSSPELAVAGLGEAEARQKGRSVVVGKFPYSASGRALSVNRSEGFVKVVGDAKTHELLGVSIVGVQASNLISEASLAIECGALLEDVAHTIHPHPTLSEMIAEACEDALGECTHLPFKKGGKK